MADQHRYDTLGCAGDPIISTPNIDRLAAEGTRYTNAYCLGPLCMPARASFLTERYVSDHGVEDNNRDLDAATPTFLHSLVDAGYTTTCIGKMHLWVHAGLRPISGVEAVADTRKRFELMRAYGFTEPIETVGKLATGAIGSEYTDYLAAEGLLDRYRAWVRDRFYFGSGGRTPLPNWETGSVPLPDEAYIDTWHGKRVCDWLEARDDDRPFFLWVGFPGPHDPWDAPDSWASRYDEDAIPMPGTSEPPASTPWAPRFDRFLNYWLRFSASESLTPERVRAVRRFYYGNVSAIDAAIGQIVQTLERVGDLDNTWIIYTSDHGEMLGEHRLLMKMVFYEAATKVPLIMRPPGGAAPREVDELVEQFDLSATIRSITGAGGNPLFEGRPLLDTTGAMRASERSRVWSENFGMAMVRTERWKLCIEEDGGVPAQLFDLHDDPHETENLAASAEARPVLDELQETTVRPFLAGRTRTTPSRF